MIYVISILFVFIIGMLLGSFLNVIIYRTHKEEAWWVGRSMCPHCKNELSWYELIPVFSYLWQKGKCRYCKEKISIQYPLMEIAVGSVLAFIFYKYDFSYQAVLISSIAFFLIGDFVSDLKYMELPDIFSVPAIILAIFYQLIYSSYSIQSLLIGTAFGALFFIIQYVLTHGKGIGSGDIRLGVLMGILLGWPLVLYGIMVSYVGGSLVAVSLLLTKRMTMKSAMPLGVFLIPALAVVFVYSNEIMRYVTDMMSFSLY